MNQLCSTPYFSTSFMSKLSFSRNVASLPQAYFLQLYLFDCDNCSLNTVVLDFACLKKLLIYLENFFLHLAENDLVCCLQACQKALDLRWSKFQRNATLLKRQLTWQYAIFVFCYLHLQGHLYVNRLCRYFKILPFLDGNFVDVCKSRLTIRFNGHLRKKGISGLVKVNYEDKTLSIEVKVAFLWSLFQQHSPLVSLS